MPLIGPLRLKPLYKRYLWGGRRFETILGRRLGPGDDYAESWEVCDHASGVSIVEGGPWDGLSLGELVRTHGDQLLGRHHPQNRFPLLLKYLDARQRLSVQVHPTDEQAVRMGLSDPGKSEAWVVMEAEPGSPLWAGFRHPMSRNSLREALERGTLEQRLHRCEPIAGECYFLPAGTIHALGGGILVAEIQAASDITFRLHDWDRPGPDGEPRPLHIEEGLASVRYDQGPVHPQRPRATGTAGVDRLVECDKFVLDRWTLTSAGRIGGDDRCHVVTVLHGRVAVEGDPAGESMGCGQTLLVPAAAGSVAVATASPEPAILLDAFLP